MDWCEFFNNDPERGRNFAAYEYYTTWHGNGKWTKQGDIERGSECGIVHSKRRGMTSECDIDEMWHF
jgi:hypothetical protein